MTSYTAQALASGTDSLAVIASQEGIVKALVQQGTKVSDYAFIVGSVTLNNAVLKRTGPDSNGMSAIAATAIADPNNAGTKQFFAELQGCQQVSQRAGRHCHDCLEWRA